MFLRTALAPKHFINNTTFDSIDKIHWNLGELVSVVSKTKQIAD